MLQLYSKTWLKNLQKFYPVRSGSYPKGPSGHRCCSDVLPPFSVSNQLLESNSVSSCGNAIQWQSRPFRILFYGDNDNDFDIVRFCKPRFGMRLFYKIRPLLGQRVNASCAVNSQLKPIDAQRKARLQRRLKWSRQNTALVSIANVYFSRVALIEESASILSAHFKSL